MFLQRFYRRMAARYGGLQAMHRSLQRGNQEIFFVLEVMGNETRGAAEFLSDPAQACVLQSFRVDHSTSGVRNQPPLRALHRLTCGEADLGIFWSRTRGQRVLLAGAMLRRRSRLRH